MKLSFCIPTLNRPEYLINTIRSICSDKNYSSKFEICIYNNYSELDYSDVEKEINILSQWFTINYKKGSSRLEIDQSMFEAIEPAIGEYLFLIGDDDYLEPDGIKDIYNLFDEIEFDLAVFNALRVSDNVKEKTELIGVFDKQYFDFENALLELKEYCTYGNLLLKKELLNLKDFRFLFGTSHAYGCFWLSFFRDYEVGKMPIIIIPKKSVVCLRYVEKSYDIMQVTFGHSHLEHKLYFSVIGEKSQNLLTKFEKKINKRFTSVMFLVNLGISNNDLSRIKKININYYKKNYLKIITSQVLVKFLLFLKKPLKKILRIKWLHKIVFNN